MVGRKLCAVYQWIMKLAHYRVRLIIGEGRCEPHQIVLQRHLEGELNVDGPFLGDKAGVADEDCIGLLEDLGVHSIAHDLNLLLLRRVIIQAPHICA